MNNTCKHSITFKEGTPGGYQGTHRFWTKREMDSFIVRFEQRIGKPAHLYVHIPENRDGNGSSD